MTPEELLAAQTGRSLFECRAAIFAVDRAARSRGAHATRKEIADALAKGDAFAAADHELLDERAQAHQAARIAIYPDGRAPIPQGVLGVRRKLRGAL